MHDPDIIVSYNGDNDTPPYPKITTIICQYCGTEYPDYEDHFCSEGDEENE